MEGQLREWLLFCFWVLNFANHVRFMMKYYKIISKIQ